MNNARPRIEDDSDEEEARTADDHTVMDILGAPRPIVPSSVVTQSSLCLGYSLPGDIAELFLL